MTNNLTENKGTVKIDTYTREVVGKVKGKRINVSKNGGYTWKMSIKQFATAVNIVEKEVNNGALIINNPDQIEKDKKYIERIKRRSTIPAVKNVKFDNKPLPKTIHTLIKGDPKYMLTQFKNFIRKCEKKHHSNTVFMDNMPMDRKSSIINDICNEMYIQYVENPQYFRSKKGFRYNMTKLASVAIGIVAKENGFKRIEHKNKAKIDKSVNNSNKKEYINNYWSDFAESDPLISSYNQIHAYNSTEQTAISNTIVANMLKDLNNLQFEIVNLKQLGYRQRLITKMLQITDYTYYENIKKIKEVFRKHHIIAK